MLLKSYTLKLLSECLISLKKYKYDKINFNSKSNASTPASKSVSLNASLSSIKRRRNKENIDLHTSDDASLSAFDSRKKSMDHEKYNSRNERNELLEINRRQAECLKMLEEEYKKLEDDHQHLQIQYAEMEKKKISYVYLNEFISLNHVFCDKIDYKMI